MKKLADIPSDRRPRARRLVDWSELARQMKADPGEWYVVHDSVWPSTATRIKRGEYTMFRPATDWEVTTRGRRNQKVALVMRFVGAPGARASDPNRIKP